MRYVYVNIVCLKYQRHEIATGGGGTYCMVYIVQCLRFDFSKKMNINYTAG